MANFLGAALAASALALGPVAASAATVVADGGSYDLLADSYFFNGDFEIGDSGDVLAFDFTNTASTTATVAFGATVNQVSAAFRPGVAFRFGSEAPLLVAGGAQGAFSSTYFVDAGETVTLRVAFGQVVDTGPRVGGIADIDFVLEAAVAPVPVPASALLLASAVGGIALARRRKARAA